MSDKRPSPWCEKHPDYMRRCPICDEDKWGELQAERDAALKRYRELYCALWVCPPDEFDGTQEAYSAALVEAERQNRKVGEYRAALAKLTEWRDSVLSALKAKPEFVAAEWAGDKQGWGFVFEFINWLYRDRADKTVALAKLRDAAKMAAKADWSWAIELRAAIAEANKVLTP